MKKVPPLLPSNFPFHRRCFPLKLGLTFPVCLRYIVFVLLAIVTLLYLRLFLLQSQSDKSNSELTKWRIIRGNGSSKWAKPRKECERVFSGDKALVRRMVQHRRKMKDPDELEMNCEAIFERHGGDSGQEDFVKAKDGRKITEVERLMPMAFVRAVYTDYLFLEAELLVNYAPNNWYCYVLDSKSSAAFQLRMRQLASCFDNVIVVDPMFDIDRVGFNMNRALMECVRTLSDERKQWKYLVTLQNHDVQAKTNAEMAQIFTWLGGANDVEVELQLPFTKKRLSHYRQKFDWTFEALHLFKDEAKNRRTDGEGKALALTLSKGYVTVALAREFVDFVVNELDVTILLKQLSEGIAFLDEHFWQSLSSSESLDAPGGFPNECFVKGIDEKQTSYRKYKYITRFALWADPSSKCLSDNWRHAVCVFGLEDLMGPDSEIRRLPHLFVNKLMQEFDFDAILCWHQWMREKVRSGRMELDRDFYMDWPQTRYQRERGLRKEVGDHGTVVDCDSGMVRLKKPKAEKEKKEEQRTNRKRRKMADKRKKWKKQRKGGEENGQKREVQKKEEEERGQKRDVHL